MWLVYLRFDDNNEIKTYHVTEINKIEAEKILALAEKHGLSATSKLVKYAIFYAHATIKPKHVPNFHFYKGNEFTSRWEKVKAS
ncbi:MAG: hypothetical protein HS126_04895 [Anaerolineales bacterium]|nr:hypothetical protein [Anaerolineales bacterium]